MVTIAHTVMIQRRLFHLLYALLSLFRLLEAKQSQQVVGCPSGKTASVLGVAVLLEDKKVAAVNGYHDGDMPERILRGRAPNRGIAGFRVLD